MHWRYMTLAIKQKCFRIVLITKDFLYSVIFAYAHITPLRKGPWISFGAMNQSSYTLRMEECQSSSVPKS